MFESEDISYISRPDLRSERLGSFDNAKQIARDEFYQQDGMYTFLSYSPEGEGDGFGRVFWFPKGYDPFFLSKEPHVMWTAERLDKINRGDEKIAVFDKDIEITDYVMAQARLVPEEEIKKVTESDTFRYLRIGAAWKEHFPFF